MYRRLLFGCVLLLPTLAVGGAGYLWFAAGSTSASAARVWVFPSVAQRLVVRALVGQYPMGEAQASLAVQLTVLSANGRVHRATDRTTAQGVADFCLPVEDLELPLQVELVALGPADVAGTLASGWVAALPAAKIEPLQPADRLTVRQGQTGVSVSIREGVLAVPFVAHVRADLALSAGDLCFTELSGVVVRDQTLCCNQWCVVYPTEHVVELSVERSHAGDAQRRTVLLPVVPGAMPVVLSAGSIQIFSATPRQTAHLAWVNADQVLSFDKVALERLTAVATTDGEPIVRSGTPVFSGSLTVPLVVQERLGREPLWLVTSSEADFVSNATVGWPLSPSSSSLGAVTLALNFATAALDGYAQAANQHRSRLIYRRRWGTGLIGGGLALEVLLLGVYVRASTTDARILLRSARVGWWAVISCVALAFVGLVGLFWWR